MTESPTDVERRGTFWVLEDPYLPTRQRWYCHWDGDVVPNLDDLDNAVAWGIAHACGVVVRTLDGVSYLAGAQPPNYGDKDLRSWPPSASDRSRIDAAYEAWLAAELAEDDSRQSYVRERNAWIRTHAPEVARHEPAHACVVFLPHDESSAVEFEELDPSGGVCAGRRQRSASIAFGSARDVIATTSGRPVDHPWVGAVCAALSAERNWITTGRRSMLLVKMGAGEMFHATAVANRDSISRHGLDWRRMSTANGIAGSHKPELPAIFLCESREDVGFFTDMSQASTDVWAVRVDGLWLEGDPGADGGGGSNWMIVTEPIGPDRLKLVDTDVVSRRPL